MNTRKQALEHLVRSNDICRVVAGSLRETHYVDDNGNDLDWIVARTRSRESKKPKTREMNLEEWQRVDERIARSIMQLQEVLYIAREEQARLRDGRH